jgi:hypothetical protein
MVELSKKPGQEAYRETDNGIAATSDNPGEFSTPALDRVTPRLSQWLPTGNVISNSTPAQRRQPNLA